MIQTIASMTAAEERALALLRSLCSLTELQTLDDKGWLGPIFGSMGGLFAFHKRSNGKLYYQVWELSPATGQDLFRWCIVPQGGYPMHRGGATFWPLADWIIGIKLLLEADEPAFRQIAICQWDHRAQLTAGMQNAIQHNIIQRQQQQ